MPAPKSKKKSRKGTNKQKRNVKQNHSSQHKNTKPKNINQQTKINHKAIKPQTGNKVQNICGYCAKSSATSRCGACKLVYYCNRKCQSSHWSKHKMFCKSHRPQNKKINDNLFDIKNLNTDNTYLKRIDFLLHAYEMVIVNDAIENKLKDVYQLVCSHYHECNVHHFINDYYKYVQNIDNNGVYKHNLNQCNLDKCHYIQRKYRNRNIYEDTKKRSTLYHGSTSEKSIVMCQLLDTLHVTKYHLVDIGLRYVNDKTKSDDSDLIRMRDILAGKRNKFNSIRKDISTNTNKFLTQIFTEQKGDDQIASRNDFGFGFRFYYHSYYRNNNSEIERLPGVPVNSGFVDYGNSLINPKYTFAMWYVKQKHKTMKDEVMYGEKKRVSITEYKNTYTKAILKLNALKNIMQGSMFVWQKLYGIPMNSPITLNHILSVMFYTNFTELSSEFSRSFRRLFSKESDESVKQRHSQFACWAKYLREAVECWGHSSYSQTTISSWFYHGLSRKMMFKGFRQRCYGPMSTTLQYCTAVMFANQGNGEGIVISIDNSTGNCVYFNCVPWSDFPAEYEMLFIGGFNPLYICGLTSIDDGMQFDEWVQSIIMFQTGFIHGHASQHKIENKHKECIVALVYGVLKLKTGKSDVKQVPKYMQQLFQNLLMKTKTLQIGICVLNKDNCGVEEFHNTYGYKSLKYIYFDANENIKWNVLKQLFPNVNTIHVSKTKKVSGTITQEKFAPSIMITNELLKNILVECATSDMQWKWITIYYPQNTQKSLHVLLDANELIFGKFGFSLIIEKIDHPQYGTCKCFTIVMSGFNL